MIRLRKRERRFTPAKKCALGSVESRVLARQMAELSRKTVLLVIGHKEDEATGKPVEMSEATCYWSYYNDLDAIVTVMSSEYLHE